MLESREIVLVYSEKDDLPFHGVMKGWVTSFHRFLKTLLYQITREEPEIHLLNESNIEPSKLDQAWGVIGIVTNNLVENPEMTNVLDNYIARLRSSNRLVVDSIPRFFKVLKKPFNADSFLPSTQELLSYDFFLQDPLTGEIQEFDQFFGEEAEQSFWMKLVDLAYDINKLFNVSVETTISTDEETSLREKTIYLASTGVDLVIQRDMIKRELNRHGFKVLPNHSLPKEEKSLRKMIKKDLALSRVSIHLIGEDYGYKPKGSEISVVEIQNELAAECTINSSALKKESLLFNRLIWLSPELKNVTERQKIFIENLKSNIHSLEETEVLQLNIQEFKNIIRKELTIGNRYKIKKRADTVKQSHADETKLIYIIADKRDIEKIEQLKRYFKKEGYNVIHPRYEGDLIDLRYVHQENLRKCDAAIIYFGSTNKEWVNIKLQDLLKAPGFGRNKPFLSKAIYIEGENEIDVLLANRLNAIVIKQTETFNPENLLSFISQMES